jgi:hypothetical protein
MYKAYRLPCRHILFFRRSKGEPMFDPKLIEERWTIKYNAKALKPIDRQYATTQSMTLKMHKKVKSHAQKFRQAHALAKDVCDVAAESTGAYFEEKMEFLTSLREAWTNGERVALVLVSKESGGFSVSNYSRQ